MSATPDAPKPGSDPELCELTFYADVASLAIATCAGVIALFVLAR